MFGRHPRLAIDACLGIASPEENTIVSQDLYDTKLKICDFKCNYCNDVKIIYISVLWNKVKELEQIKEKASVYLQVV